MQVKYNVHDRAVVTTNPYLNPTLNVHASAVFIMEVGVRVTGSCEVKDVE
jgi:hypothetical protein